MPTTTSLNLQALLKTTAVRTGLDGVAQKVRGLSPPAQAFYAAIQSSSRRNALTVVVVPTDEHVEQFCSDLKFFVGALDGVAPSTLDEIIRPFPSLQIDPYRRLAPHFHIASARAAALHGLTLGSVRVVVASGAALLPRLSTPDRFRAASKELKPGQELDPTLLEDLLTEAGFTREDPVDEHGEFCVRGGIIDWFPAGAEHPVRVEFVGDTIESIRRYDPATQRSSASLDYAAVVPLREMVGAEATSSTVFDYFGGRALTMLVSEESDVETEVAALEEQLTTSYEEARVEDGGVPAPEDSFVPWRDIAPRLSAATRLEQLAIDEGGPEARPELALTVACQPAVEFRGRIQEWIAEVRRMRDRGDTVLFVAGSEGRAERTSELLGEYGLRGVLLDRTDELLN